MTIVKESKCLTARYKQGVNQLPLLADQKSDAKEVQAVCMITIAKMVQAAKAAQIQAHLVQLVPALLESLSSMEVQLPMQPGVATCIPLDGFSLSAWHQSCIPDQQPP